MAATAIEAEGQGSRNLFKDEAMLHRFKISAEKMFWVMAAGAVAIPVLVIVYETNFGPTAGQ
jgi:hypothetical protein